MPLQDEAQVGILLSNGWTSVPDITIMTRHVETVQGGLREEQIAMAGGAKKEDDNRGIERAWHVRKSARIRLSKSSPGLLMTRSALVSNRMDRTI